MKRGSRNEWAGLLIPLSPLPFNVLCSALFLFCSARDSQGETAGDLTSRREWTGPMAQAFGLLGGAEVTYHKRRRDSIGATVSAGWVASLSKKERLLEVACLRLKQAMKWVSNLSKPSV